MMLLLNGEALSKSFGVKQLFKQLTLSVFEKDRIGLIGQNGSGKSTLMKILAGLESSDQGTLSPRRGLKIGYLPQACDAPDKKPLEILLEGLKDEDDREQIAKKWLNKLGLREWDRSAAELSGGWKKRIMLAQAAITAPDLLLLDEPTNHLDLEGILWLETFLENEVPTYLIISHDRYFLQKVTNRIIEIDPAYPKGLFAIDGSYSFFLSKKEEFLQGQIAEEHSLASKARREKEWLRSNPKARTAKSQSRIDQAEEILDELSELGRRNMKRKLTLDFTASERETRKLLVAKSLTKEPLFRGLDFTFSPGTRLGLMGPNGSGKTTLLRLLAGELSADSGTIKRAEDLQTVYFDQYRTLLPLDISLRDALSPTGDYVTFRGQKIHVNGWCKRFLFSPDILDLPIGKLSGGERARIAIAHLMLQPADLLLLDEPTNDLDIPTLEALEETLIDFPGAVVLITHDRCMLERVCNHFLALGDPDQTTLFAEYAQWEAKEKIEAPKKEKPAPVQQGLSIKEKREYDRIESKIKALEVKLEELSLALCDPSRAQDAAYLKEICDAIAMTNSQIEQLFLRWHELEEKS
jgi:ABC transport system ATP-binding/permease protein